MKKRSKNGNRTHDMFGNGNRTHEFVLRMRIEPMNLLTNGNRTQYICMEDKKSVYIYIFFLYLVFGEGDCQ
jgi:hypothetical protein